MSILAMTKVYASGLEKSMKAIALAYADHAHDDGSHIYPSVDYVAWKTGFSRRSVQVITSQLVEVGVLVCDGKGNKGTNRYRMLFENLPVRAPFRGADSAPPQTDQPSWGAESAPQEVQKTAQGGAAAAPEPSYKHQENRHIDNATTEETADDKNTADESLQIAWGMLMTFCDNNKDTAVRLWQLQSHLAEVSRLPLPDIDTERGRAELQRAWWPVLLEIDQKAGGELATAKTGMNTAVSEIDAWKPEALQAPKSILKKTIAYFAAAQRGAANGHVTQMPSYAQYKI